MVDVKNWRRYCFLQKNIFRFFPDLAQQSDLNELTWCQTIRNQVVERQADLISQILNVVFNAEEIDGIAKEIAHGEQSKLDAQISDLHSQEQSTRSELAEKIRKANDLEVSLIKCFTAEAKNDRISTVTKQIRDIVSTYAGSWLKPETLVDIGKKLSVP